MCLAYGGLSRYCVHFEGLIGGVGGPGVGTFVFSSGDGAGKHKCSVSISY